MTHPLQATHKFKPHSWKVSAVLPAESSRHGSYDTVSWAGMNKLDKIRIDPKPELAIPIWYLYLSLCTCVASNVCFCSLWEPIRARSRSLIDFPANNNEALLWGAYWTIFSPLRSCLLLFSWIPLLKLAQRLHCAWVWCVKRRNRKLYIQESEPRVRSVSQGKNVPRRPWHLS